MDAAWKPHGNQMETMRKPGRNQMETTRKPGGSQMETTKEQTKTPTPFGENNFIKF
jgi:hypothetical protein